MSQIKFKGNTVNSVGQLPSVGKKAPAFNLVANDLSDCKLSDFAGKTVILSIFPSCDTGVCANAIRKFNEAAGQLEETIVVNASMDLPFAQKRFCESEGIKNVKILSGFRSPNFGSDYGVTMTDGPMRGLYCRAVVIIDGQGTVVHTELVPEITQEPNYDSVLSAAAQMA
jgi:thiol peroxidase